MTRGRLIFLWCLPRSRSTVLLRCLHNLPNTKCMFEPFNNIILGGPSNPLVGTPYEGVVCDADPSLTIQNFITRLEQHLSEGFDVIVKDFGFSAMPFIDLLPLKEAKHVLVIRHPALVNLSWYNAFQKMDPPVLAAFKVMISRLFANRDSGFEQSSSHPFEKAKTFFDLLKSKGCDTIVVESKDLQEKPEASVRAICDFTGLPFEPGCLTWESSDRFPDSWQVPSPCVQRQARLKLQKAVINSTGLQKSKEQSLEEIDTSMFTDAEKQLTQSEIPYYLQLQKECIQMADN